MPLTIPYKCTAKEISHHVLDARLSSELSGLFNLALNSLERFRSKGDRYSIGDSMMESFEEFRQVTDLLAIWLDRFTELTAEGVVAKGVLYESYKAWAEDQRQPVLTPRTFGVSLKELRPTIEDSQRRLEGKRSEIWLGLQLKGTSLYPN